MEASSNSEVLLLARSGVVDVVQLEQSIQG
jgi:hypothetical protein